MEETVRIDGEQTVGAGETQGARRASGVSPARDSGKKRSGTADVEVLAKATRRQFSAEYKRRILREAAAAREAGEIGALLRREGLYFSYLNTWSHQCERGELAALTPRRRGRKEKAVNPLAKRVAELDSDKRSLERKLQQAELLLDIQKKASQLLQIPLSSLDEDGNT